MKNLIVIIIGLIILLSGCLKVYNDTYTVVNNTNKHIKIKGFAVELSKKNQWGILYNETIDIQPSSKFTILKGKGENSQPRGIFLVNDIDSVNIIFDNTRIIKYRCNKSYGLGSCDDMRNILNFNKYYEQVKGEHESTFTYTITEEDYELADTIK